MMEWSVKFFLKEVVEENKKGVGIDVDLVHFSNQKL